MREYQMKSLDLSRKARARFKRRSSLRTSLKAQACSCKLVHQSFWTYKQTRECLKRWTTVLLTQVSSVTLHRQCSFQDLDREPRTPEQAWQIMVESFLKRSLQIHLKNDLKQPRHVQKDMWQPISLSVSALQPISYKSTQMKEVHLS